MIAEATSYIDAVEHLPPGGTLLLHNVTWVEYEAVLCELKSKPAYRIYFDNGVLKIMSPRADHEFPKEVALAVARLYAEVFDLEMDAYGATTWRKHKKMKGVEADTSFFVANACKVRGIKDFGSNLEIPPDVVVEIDTTNESWDKFEIYAHLGVAEIWRCDGRTFQIYTLVNEKYETVVRSLSFPRLTGLLLTESLEIGRERGQSAMLKELKKRFQSC